jgi:four helix bundle protein
MGSACEVEYQVVLAMDLEYLDRQAGTTLVSAVAEVKRMLASLISTVSLADS